MGEKRDLVQQRCQKLEEICKLGYDPYPHKYPVTHTIAELVEKFSHKSSEELQQEPTVVQSAGRLVNLRGHGKAGFADILGAGIRIQVYIRQDRVGEQNHKLFQLLDIGDIVGVRGSMFRTKTNELTISAEQVDFLAKGLLPLPEKWHGLSDVEIRYRQRYLDLIANQEVREIFVRRSRIISEIRTFLESRGYLEVETPMMQPLAGGAIARPFKTFHEALSIPLFLRIAPELYLKRLIVGGFDRVFEINRSFRNEGISTLHNPEFTMLEFYQAYSNYEDLMNLTEEMLQQIVQNIAGRLEITFKGNSIDFKTFARYSMVESIRKFWKGEDSPSAQDLCSHEQLMTLRGALGLEFQQQDSWGSLLGELFRQVVEGNLIEPTFIYDFPAELSPLSKLKDDDPRFAERFELFVGGLEIANAYSELNDPEEQERRFKKQVEARDRGDQEAHEMDVDYLQALRYGMPPTAGEGIGIDRLTMVLTDSQSIREVILFPHLRPSE
ncbi:lysine--tRNA ligase [Acidobacteria bacterium AH-259-D05]|nr:lysine--tRNA ligase [Acidobacteria bacterium AH-259-D05]